MNFIIQVLLFILPLAPLLECANAKPQGYRPQFTLAQITEMESKLIYRINQERTSRGLKALQHWPKLSDCARGHSHDMAVNKVPFGHDGFKDRAEKMKREAPLKSFAENVAYSFNMDDPLETACTGWMKSKGHRENILGDYQETGIGIAYSKDGRCYITQLFAKLQKK